MTKPLIKTFVANMNNGARNNTKMICGGGTFTWQEQKEIAEWMNGIAEQVRILREALAATTEAFTSEEVEKAQVQALAALEETKEAT